MGPKWGRPYHDNVTEYGEQSKVGGAHSTVVVCCIIRRFNSETEGGRYLQRASVGYCIAEFKSANSEGVKTGYCRPIVGG